MTDLGVFLVSAALVFAGGVLLCVMLAPLIVHMRWEDRRRRRGGRYIR